MDNRAEKEVHALIAAHVQRLTATQEWEVLKEEVEKMESALMDHLTTATDDLRYLQGEIGGIRKVMRLPSILMARARRP